MKIYEIIAFQHALNADYFYCKIKASAHVEWLD